MPETSSAEARSKKEKSFKVGTCGTAFVGIMGKASALLRLGRSEKKKAEEVVRRPLRGLKCVVRERAFVSRTLC